MPLFGRGSKLGEQDRWLVIKKLGEGQFAEVYEVRDNNSVEDKRYALKIERRRDVRSVKQEFKVVKKIQERNPTLVCPVHACGTFEDRFFMIMELLGNNVAEARKAAGGRFDLPTCRRIATSMLQGLEEVHAAGFVHRDVKPANFAVGPPFADPLTGTWKVIDFGLARRYLDDVGEVLPERTDTSFKGSTTYASVNAHAEADLGRRDDLWSWLYCTIELLEGTLPWRADPGKDADSREGVLRLKQACIADPAKYLRPGPSGAPEPALLGPVSQLSHYIASLGFADTPDYPAMTACLAALPDHLPGYAPPPVPGLGPGSAALAAATAAASAAAAGGTWGAHAQADHGYGQYYQQYYAQQQQQQQQQGYWQHQQQQQQQQTQRGGWGDPAGGMQQHQQHHRYPQPPDPGRSPAPGAPPADPNTTSPPDLDMSGGAQPPAPPLPPPVPHGAPPPQPAAPALPDVAPEVAEAMLAEALAERSGGLSDSCREAAQVAEVAEYVALVKQGHVSDEAHDAAGRLLALEPLEALATISYCLDALAQHTQPDSAATAAVALSALGAYARDSARRAMTKYCRAVAAQHAPRKAL
ncbi:hypothetical protein CHLRE_02g114200v5 [Chlamydomonas reinhardtii]|uniref:Protein kinase domain-containing protein n=1 Tax=Chlamydomonas reinhardtii TaxID=3055 RepID=A0A2K3E369_CHLRE|nr:uncharacterized protein CHLRE_02g114200v5 [Chlamydomonas reinhardtii]PNW87231.1 hypothetical protein CHLRE_02g114200v5 [Chlamydomonas reinhardtii]